MALGFRKDIFSKYKVDWTYDVNKKNFNDIKIIILKYISSSEFIVKQNNGIELNSSNFKLIFKSKHFILKKWPDGMMLSEIKKTLNLMIWLNKKKIPVPIPQNFKNRKIIIKFNNNYWSYFNFIDGNHFKGKLIEMKNVAKFLGNLMNVLDEYPIKKIRKQLEYFSEQDNEILNFMKKNINKLDKYFSKKHSKIIRRYFPKIFNTSQEFRKMTRNKKIKSIIHMDIHPHNILTKNNKVKALLDLDSCVLGRVDYSISYAALKICKQTVIYNKTFFECYKIRQQFMNNLQKTYKKQISKQKEINLYYYAVSEVLRRLLYMFKLTILKKDKKWNDIIPIQIEHLIECEKLFLATKN